MSRYLCTLPLILVLVIALSCDDDQPITPPTNTEPDSTSQDFAWEQWPIGIYGTHLYDIAAFSDSDVWVCGEVWDSTTHKLDTNGITIPANNLAHWNGKTWTFYNLLICGISLPSQYALHSFFPLALDDIWIVGSSKLVQWTPSSYESWCVPDEVRLAQIRVIGGRKNDMYLCGIDGTAIHFDGTTFRKVNLGATQTVYDIWTNRETTLCIATYEQFVGSQIFKLENGNAAPFDTAILPHTLHALWFDERVIYTGGSTIKQWQDGVWYDHSDAPARGFIEAIRGIHSNDVFFAGDFGTVLHWNGKRWRLFVEADPTGEMSLISIAYIRNHVFITGYDDSGKFWVIHGKRK